MRKVLCATVVIAAAVAPSTADAKQGCRTRACLRRVCRSEACHRRVWAKRHPEAVTSSYDRAWLRRVRMCESGGDYGANTGNGFYGAYQFTLSSWGAAGGAGRPDLAAPAEQDRRALRLRAIQGTGAWPVCG